MSGNSRNPKAALVIACTWGDEGRVDREMRKQIENKELVPLYISEAHRKEKVALRYIAYILLPKEGGYQEWGL